MIDTMPSNYNTFLAIILSFFVIVLWGFLFPTKPTAIKKKPVMDAKEYKSISQMTNSTKQVKIDSDFLDGSITLTGFKFEDILFKKYYTTQEKKENVRLFHPNNTMGAYFAEMGWVSKSSVILPGNETLWNADRTSLRENETVTLNWNNNHGLEFIMKITLDDRYMFKIEQKIINDLDYDIDLSSYSRINKICNDFSSSNFILYEGPIGMFDKSLQEISFKSLVKNNKKFSVESNSEQRKWFGFSDKYWASIIAMESNLNGKVYFQHAIDKNNDNKFQVGYKNETETLLKAKSSASVTYYLFTGPKELSLLDMYEKKYKIFLFDRVLDFGILYFITKPILLTLKYLYDLIGNFGFAIIALTLIIRILTLPLSIQSFLSMLKIKALQPKIQSIKAIYKDDKVKLSKEVSALFKKHSVRPLSGCLPTLLQIPIFFALYKVLLISIEMRHAEFIFWIKDLSVKDPTNILNLFGLIPIDLPFSIGILPIILSMTMIIQQKVSAPSFSDKSQMMAMKLMPYVFVFVFASFPSGLILYWIFSNLFTIIQQSFLKKYFVFQKIM